MNLMSRYKKEKKGTAQLVFLLFFAILFIYQTNSQCCLQFKQSLCVKCPQNMHLYRNNCIYDILNCESYSNGFDCQKCKSGYTLNKESNLCEISKQKQKQINVVIDNKVNKQNYNSQDTSKLTIAAQQQFDPSSYQTVPEFAIGYEIFKSRPQVKGSQVIKLSRQLNLGRYNYFIRFFNEKDKKTYQAIYYIDIKKDQIIPMAFNQIQIPLLVSGTPGIPSNQDIPTSFAGLNINFFKNDKEASLSQSFIRNLRTSQLLTFKLDSVRIAINGSFYYYELTFYSFQKRQYYTAIVKQSIKDPNTILFISQKSIQQKSGSLSKQDYQNDFKFVDIRKFLLNKYKSQIEGQKIKRVILSSRNQNKNVVSYTIVYDSSKLSEYFFDVNYDVSNHDITLIKFFENTNDINNPNSVQTLQNKSVLKIENSQNSQNSKIGALTKAQWTNDISFQQIMKFLQNQFGTIIKSFPIQSVIKTLSSSQSKDIYTIVFNPKNGNNTPFKDNIFSDNFITLDIDSKGNIKIISVNAPDLRLKKVTLENNNASSIITKVAVNFKNKDDWQKDQGFVNINKGFQNYFKNTNGCSQFSEGKVLSVSYQELSGIRLYRIEYQGVGRVIMQAKYNVQTKEVLNIKQIGRAQIQPQSQTKPSQPPHSTSFQFTNKAQWEKDQSFINVNDALQNYFKNANGYTQFYLGKVLTVRYQELVGVRAFRIQYQAAESISRIIMGVKYNIQTKEVSNIKQIGRTQIQPPPQPKLQPPKTISVQFNSKAQWEKDESFKGVDQALQNYFKNTNGFNQFYQGKVLSVSYQELLGLRTFRFEYQAAESISRIIIKANYNIQTKQVSNIKEVGRTQIQPTPQPKPQPTSYQFKNKAQWEKDESFKVVDQAFQNYFKNTNGFNQFYSGKVLTVSYEELIGVRAFRIEYQAAQSILRVIMGGKYNIQTKQVSNIKQIGRTQIESSPQPKPQPPQKISFQFKNKDQWQKDESFVLVNSALQKYFKNTSNSTQFYEGKVKSVTYEQISPIRTFNIQYQAAQSISRIKIIVQYNIQAKQVLNIKELGRTQIQPPILPLQPPKPISFQFNNKSQWQKDQSFIAVDLSLQNYFKTTNGSNQFYKGKVLSVSYEQISPIRTFNIEYQAAQSILRIKVSVQYNVQTKYVSNIKELGRTQILPPVSVPVSPQPQKPISYKFNNNAQWQKHQSFSVISQALQNYFKNTNGLTQFYQGKTLSVSYQELQGLRTYRIEYQAVNSAERIMMEIKYNIQTKETSNIKQVGRTQIQPPISPQPSKPISYQFINKAEWQKDDSFNRVNKALQQYFKNNKQSNQFYQGKVLSVNYQQISPIRTFNIQYQAGQLILRIKISVEYNIQTKQVLNIKELGRTQIQPVNPKPITPILFQFNLKTDWQKDQGFISINLALQNYFKSTQGFSDFVNAQPTKVTYEQIGKFRTYQIQYKKSIFKIIMQVSYDIELKAADTGKIKEIARTAVSPNLPPAISPPTKSIQNNGNIPRTKLTPQQYQNDLGFKQVKAYLQSKENLKGFKITSVSFSLQNNIWRYSITYQNNLQLIVYETIFNPDKKTVQIEAVAQSATQKPINTNTIQIQLVPPILVQSGQKIKLNKQQYQNDFAFKQVRKFLETKTNLIDYQITSVYFTIQNGLWKYSITYQNNKDIKIYDTLFYPDKRTVQIEAVAQSAVQPKTPSIITIKLSPPVNIPGDQKVKLTKEQYENDPGFKIVDSYLKSQKKNLSQYTIQLVDFEIKPSDNGLWRYYVSYLKYPELVYMVTTFNPANQIVTLVATALNSPQPVQIQKPKPLSPIPIIDKKQQKSIDIKKETASKVQTKNINPQIILKSGTSSYILLKGQQQISMDQFLLNYQNQATYIIHLNSDLFSSASIQRIIYNKGSNYWKFFLQSALYFKLTFRPSENIYFIQQIVPLISQTQTMIESFSFQDKVEIDKILKLSSKVKDVKGSYYPINNALLIHYNKLLVTLENDMKYQVSFLGNRASRSNFVLISYRLVRNQNTPKFNFKNSPLTNIPINVTAFLQNMLSKSFLLNIVSYQVDTSIPTLYRVIIITIQGKAQIIYDSQKSVVYSYDLIDTGFTTLSQIPNNSVFKNGQSLVASYCKLSSNYKIVSVKERSINGNTQYDIFYELPTGTYQAFVTYSSSNKKYYLNSFKEKSGSGLGKQQYVPTIFQKSQIVDTQKALNSPQFVQSQNLLMSQYSHHLINPQIRSIYTKKEGQNTVIYEIIYDTLTGTFLAVLNYDYQKKMPIIKSLVLIDVGKLTLSIVGCQISTSNQKFCTKCKQGYHLSQDQFCFKDIQNCSIHSGNLCLACKGNNLLISNICTYQCQPYCIQNGFPNLK